MTAIERALPGGAEKAQSEALKVMATRVGLGAAALKGVKAIDEDLTGKNKS